MQDSETRIIHLNEEGKALRQKSKEYKSNVVRTSKYNLITFIPFNLFEQFTTKLANLYFLVIMFMQMIKQISISDGQPAMLPPLAFVVCLSMIKDAYEDYKRHKEDHGENSATTLVFSKEQNKFVTAEWKRIVVGDVVRVREDEFFPADMVMIQSTEPEGVFYVETKNLDGETNLKLKAVSKDFVEHFDGGEQQFGQVDGALHIEKPNNRIYNFDGNAQLTNLKLGTPLGVNDSHGEIQEERKSSSAVPLSNDSVALRGMSLRNTEYVTGIVVYTGHDSKIQKNSSGAVYKTSNIMRITNKQILLVFCIQILAASIGSIIGTSWMIDNLDEAKYLDFQSDDKWNTTWGLLFIKNTGTWILIFTNFVPISLLVTLEIVKYWQGSFMQLDVEMYDTDQDFGMRAQTTNINEELGQIEYIFSDKTGTLTCNIMEFKKFSGAAGSFSLTSDDKAALKGGLKFYDKAGLTQALKDSAHPGHQSAEDVLLHLALCHSIVIDKRTGKMNSASPDELALVEGAAKQGFEFKGKDADGVIHIQRKRDMANLEFTLLNTLEFNSTRKRMSVIIHNKQTNKIELLCKGADSIIKARLAYQNSPEMVETQKYVDAYAEEGLRTLLLSKRTLDDAYYQQWNQKFQHAMGLVVDKQEAVDECQEEIESQMELIGSTAIEDRLQEQVKETIEAFKETGIKVWVLTGDKVETAINIGYSCGLLNNNMQQFVINTSEEDEIRQLILEIQQYKVKAGHVSSKKEALVIAGEALTQVQQTQSLRDEFLKVTDWMDVVIACRVSPKQKGDIVEMIRKRFPKKMTLAVGDGANDVAMIMKAHVGVGIAGREGMQAARASDYAIGKFKFLKPLMFYHGRESYRRIAFLVSYNFYKNILYVVVQYYFGFYSVFSGQTLYEPWVYQVYNITFTGGALFWWGLFDFQHLKSRFLQEPDLYKVGLEGQLFSTKVFWGWQLYALIQALLVLFIGMVFPQLSPVESGKTYNFWAGGHMVYFMCVLLANLVLLRNTHNFTGFGEFVIALQLISFFVILYLDSVILDTGVIAYFFDEYFGSWTAWLGCLLVGSSIYVEKAVLDAVHIIRQMRELSPISHRRVVSLREDGQETAKIAIVDHVDLLAAPYNELQDESEMVSVSKVATSQNNFEQVKQ